MPTNFQLASRITFFISVGSGMYIQVPSVRHSMNNSIVTVRYYSGYYSCPEYLKVFCYSDSSLSSAGYVTAYNGHRYYSGSYNYLTVRRQDSSGLLLWYSSCRYSLPSGVYTCEIPDANGTITESSIAVYSSTPGIFEDNK